MPEHEPADDGQPDGDRFSVVGIGAPAGGLEALQVFFGQMPHNSGMAFVAGHIAAPTSRTWCRW
jgi:two-component system CheB/CheR fusion protein